MTVTLTVGTNTYVTLTQANTYMQGRSFSSAWDEKTEDERVNALVLAARHLDYAYEWLGNPTLETQAMAWPREGVFTRQGREYDNDEYPQELKDAQCELALQWIQADQLMPAGTFLAQGDTAAQSGGIKRQKLGDLEIEYKDDSAYLFSIGAYAPQKKTYPYVDLLLRHLVDGTSGDSFQRIRI